MSSELLKWVANGLIAVVLFSTLWMAHSVRPDQEGSNVLLAQVAAPSMAASAPATTAR